jgi:tripartite-type tricarboxylate transporter receptor subunit TctC
MKKIMALMLLMIASTVMANDTIRLIVPFTAGGPVDRIARLIQKDMQTAGRKVVVEHKPGGNGEIALNHMLQLGRTESAYMLVGSALGFAIKPHLNNSSIEAVVDIGRTPLMITVPRGGRISSWQQFLSNNNNDPITFGSAGQTSLSFLTSEIIKAQTQKNLINVPYPGGPKILIDLLTARLDLGISNLSDVTSFIETQQLTPLAVTSERRLPNYPTVPTLTELGIKDGIVNSHMILLGLATNPQAEIAVLQSTLTAVLNNPISAAPYVNEGLTVSTGTKVPAPGWWQREIQRFRDQIARNKITINE